MSSVTGVTVEEATWFPTWFPEVVLIEMVGVDAGQGRGSGMANITTLVAGRSRLAKAVSADKHGDNVLRVEK